VARRHPLKKELNNLLGNRLEMKEFSTIDAIHLVFISLCAFARRPHTCRF
jgi:hypothetical protein